MKRLSVILVLFLAACGNNPDAENAAPGSRKLVLTGSSTVAPLAAEIALRYESEHPGVRIDVQTGGSSRGIADARSELADIGMASRALTPEEEDLHGFTVARDGVCLFVHQDNPVTEISDEDVRRIYTGEIKSWSEVGGDEVPITVVSKAEGRATLEVFKGYFGLESPQIVADVIVGDNQHAIKTVLADPGAIAYVSIGTAEYEAQNGAPLRLLPTGGIEATSENLASGSFPISRPLNLVTAAEPEGLAADFIAYARSPEVHDLVRSLHFVPVTSGDPEPVAGDPGAK